MELSLEQLVEEREFCEKLIKALTIIACQIDQNPVQYPLLVTDVLWLRYGQPVLLPDKTFATMLGLDDHIKDLCKTLELMEAEIDLVLNDV